METFPIIIVIVSHCVIAGFMIVRTAKSILLTKKQKRLNIILLILVPYFWSVLVYYMLKKEPDYFDERKNISNGDHAPPATYY